MIASPSQGKPFLLHLAVSKYAVSAVLVVEREKGQIPVYYVSYALIWAELSYPLIVKFAYALGLVSRNFAHGTYEPTFEERPSEVGCLR